MEFHSFLLTFEDPRYNIILLMPTDKTDAHRLARDLSGNSLRLLRKRLQSTWVRATIPSFMLRGFVTLTSFLQGVSYRQHSSILIRQVRFMINAQQKLIYIIIYPLILALKKNRLNSPHLENQIERLIKGDKFIIDVNFIIV